jgi:hypothetical protein
MGRLDAVRPATRPKMHGRMLLAGPSGSGKTWTALSVASVLAAAEPDGQILLVDTERESALTYADSFQFAHLPWRPPYDPTELVDVLGSVTGYAVIVVDSLTHFWRGEGGTLEIADGKIGGWKNARPVQERLVQAILGVPAHVILCVRSKQGYLVEHGGTKVTKVGMEPIQDDTLMYEVNVAAELDMEHRLTVTKSRTPAVPVGRMYPAGHERKAADDYASWLAGGVPPANAADVEALVARFAFIADEEARKTTKQMFVELFGMPQSLTADMVGEATAWLEERVRSTDPDTVEPTPIERKRSTKKSDAHPEGVSA